MTTIIKATATVVEINDAAFSTQFRYLRERSVAGAFKMVAGATCGVLRQNAGHTGDTAPRLSLYWKYQCGTYVIEKSRPATWQNNVGATIGQSLTAPTVTQTTNTVDG